MDECQSEPVPLWSPVPTEIIFLNRQGEINQQTLDFHKMQQKPASITVFLCEVVSSACGGGLLFFCIRVMKRVPEHFPGPSVVLHGVCVCVCTSLVCQRTGLTSDEFQLFEVSLHIPNAGKVRGQQPRAKGMALM